MKRIILFCMLSGVAGAMASNFLDSRDYQWEGSSALAQSEVTFPDHSDSAIPQASRPARRVAADTSQSLTTEEEINIAVYEKANPSVVNINTSTVRMDPFFMLARESEGAGSGAILDRKGHILTNYHVVDGAAKIEVTLASNQSFLARIVGNDEANDIAVLKIDAPEEDLVPIELGDSNDLRVGQKVYVLGNPFGWDGTLTTGIISSLNRNLPGRTEGRPMKSLIQTDAAMNPGNSGGPLLDTNARMVGMCMAIATRTGQNAGVGFAIPVDRIKAFVPELIAHGKVVLADVGISHVMETENGLVIVNVVPDGPADQAGLRGFRRVVRRQQRGSVLYETETIDRSQADRILAVNGEPMKSGAQFRDKIWEFKPGDEVTITISRDGSTQDVRVILGSE